ncbi:MAG: site-2 protease family protein, partial [Pseudomonadota bacterium]
EPVTYWVMAGVGLIGLALSIIVHELAHSLVARRYDMPITGITLFVFGGVAEMSEEPATPKAEFLMAAAGPLMSVAIAALCYAVAVGAVWMGAGVGNAAVVVLGYLTLINALLAGFNMIPAFPLDGGRILRAALWAWKGDVLWATRAASFTGTMLGFALMALGLWTALTGGVVTGLWWILIGLFVRAAAAGAYRQQLARRALAEQAVARLMHPEPVAVTPDTDLARLVEDYFHRDFHRAYPVVDGAGVLVGQVTIEAVRAVPRHDWPRRRVADVMEAGASGTIAEGADAGEALRRMRATGRSRLMVTQGGRLVGVLSLKDLLRVLALKSDDPAAAPEGMARRRPS